MYDCILAGLGAVGSSAAFHLASRGSRVLGLDRFAPPHALGSSHGKSRIIREAYFENPLYVPLVRRAYECWAALEAESGRSVFTRTGGLMVGPPESSVVAGARASAIAHALPYDEIAAGELRRRIPAFHPGDGDVAIWEPRAGILAPETAIETHLSLAHARGAEIRFNEAMLGWAATDDGVDVTTPRGTFHAARLVIAAGSWLRDLVPELTLPLAVERNVVYWFDPAQPTASFAPDRFPIFIHEFAPGRAWYGFPDVGDGVKVALHHQGEITDPDTVRRTVGDDEIGFVRSLLARFLPGANGSLRETTVCLYTNTPDDHFILDRHPVHASVVIASPCSGHGFKFSSAIGEVIADLVTDRPPQFDLQPFRIGRLMW
jgi:sarcosine oxidase